MNQQYEVELAKTRDFGDIIADAIKIIKNNFHVFSMGFVIYVLPIILIGGYLFILFGSEFMQLFFNPGAAQEMEDPTGILSGLGLFYIGFIFSFIMLYMFMYGFYLAYEEKEEGKKVSMDDIGTKIRQHFFRLLGIIIVLIGLVAIPGLMIASIVAIAPVIGIFLLFALFFFYIYFYNILQFVPFIYLREESGILDSIKRAIYLVRDHWWISFGIIIVASLIASFVSYIFAIPAYIMIFASAFSAVEEGSVSGNPGLMMSLAFLLMIVGSLFCSMYSVTAQVLQYYNLVEQKESHRLMDKIDEIGSSTDSLFENEGEF